MAKNKTATKALEYKLERALDKNRMKEAVESVLKLAQLPPSELPSATLHGHFFKVLDAVFKEDLKPLAQQLLTKIAAVTGLSREQQRKMGEGWLKLGEEQKALEVARKLNDADLARSIQLRATDRTVIDPKSPSAGILTPEQLAEIAVYREAFAAHEVGDAELAREKLNAIGMASPLMEWKLMLRGLIAWAAKENLKAAENWTRLKPDRLPAKLVAPLRTFVEPNSPEALAGTDFARRERHTHALLGPLMGNLAKIRTLAGQEHHREPLFRAAKEIAGELRTLSKRAFNTLASVVYWSIYSNGQPSELALYEQAFGKPEFDPKFHRLRGLVAERIHDLRMAHAEWAEYERWILRNAHLFQASHFNRLRGTLQLRIARLALDMNAAPASEADFLYDIFGRGGRGAPQPRPAVSPEPALRSAMELMPDDKAPVFELFDYLMDNERAADAKVLVTHLEQKFGDDTEALKRLESYYMENEDYPRAVACLRKNIASNPLDKTLRMRGVLMGLALARSCASGGDYEQASSLLDELNPASVDGGQLLVPAITALRGVMAAKQKDKAAWEAVKAELMSEQRRIPGAYLLLAEGNRVKLPKKEADVFLAEFKAILDKPPSLPELNLLMTAVSQYHLDPVPYRGLASHEKLLQAAVLAAVERNPSETELQSLGVMVHVARWAKTLKEIAKIGTRLYPTNAYFWFFQAESIQGPKNPPVVNRSAVRPYLRTHELMQDERATRDYTVLRRLWEERLAATPDLQVLLNEMSGPFGYF